MITKEDLLDIYPIEVQRTLKVMRAIPENQLDFKLHDRSNSIKKLLETFIVEFIINFSVVKGEQPGDFMANIPQFNTLDEAINAFQKSYEEFMDLLKSTPSDDIIQPFSMWGTDGTRGSHLLFIMFDMIHHRGQLSSYLRPAGGKVPAIYGPSGDEGIEG